MAKMNYRLFVRRIEAIPVGELIRIRTEELTENSILSLIVLVRSGILRPEKESLAGLDPMEKEAVLEGDLILPECLYKKLR